MGTQSGADTLRADTGTLVREVNSQPACWRLAAEVASEAGLPPHGSRIALVGCGTSYYAAEAIAAWRETSGLGEGDAFAASEMPRRRQYDAVVVISRSGTTTEVLRLVQALSPRVEVLAITGSPRNPIGEAARRHVPLPFADEDAVVQSRFATSVMAMWRAHLGHDVSRLADLAEERLSSSVPAGIAGFEQFVFLGQGAAVGLANEAALKFREAALAWAESYPAMELRHGPISLLESHSLVWALSELPPGLAEEIENSGARLERYLTAGDPLAELVRVHRGAIALAEAKGIDPSRPRRLTRSIVLQ